MRAVLLGLVLLNCLYWAWSRWIDVPPTVIEAGIAVPELPTLQLFDETGDGRPRLNAQVDAPVTPVSAQDSSDLNLEEVEPLILDGLGTTDVVGVDSAGANRAQQQQTPVIATNVGTTSEPGVATAVTPPPLATAASSSLQTQDAGGNQASANQGGANQGGANQGGVDQSGTEQSARAPDTGGNEALASGQTASEQTPVSQAGSDQSVLANAMLVSADPIESPARCASVGPFLNLRRATEAVSLMNANGLKTQQRVEKSEVWVGHWVFLPTYATRAEAVAVVEQLRAEGVKDIYIEPSGPLKNAISLGLFSDIEGAEVRAGNVRKLGVRPQIQDRRREGLVYWIDTQIDAGYLIDIGAFKALPNKELRIAPVACSDRFGAAP